MSLSFVVNTQALEGVRAIAALQVSIGHYLVYWGWTGSGLNVGGGEVVLLFVLMSGSVLRIGHNEQAVNSATRFWLRRLARVGPVMMCAVVVSIPTMWGRSIFFEYDRLALTVCSTC